MSSEGTQTGGRLDVRTRFSATPRCAIDGFYGFGMNFSFISSLLYFPKCSSATSTPPGGRVRHECIFAAVRRVSGVVLNCGTTLVLFTTDQKNTVYKGYIDILKVLMFIQRYSSCFCTVCFPT